MEGEFCCKVVSSCSLIIFLFSGIWTSFTCGEIPLASGGFTDRFSIDWSRHLMKIVELAGWFWYVHNSIAHLDISILHLQYWFIFSGYFNILHTILIYLFTMQMCKWRGNLSSKWQIHDSLSILWLSGKWTSFTFGLIPLASAPEGSGRWWTGGIGFGEYKIGN